MANIIQIKRSSNTTEIPHHSELAVGELAVNLADGILFTRKEPSGSPAATDVIKIGGDNYSLADASVTDGARVTLNRITTGGTAVADGTFDILGSSSVSVTHSSGQVTLAVTGGAAINKLQSDDGGSDFATPSSGIATIAGGTGITTSDSGATLTVTADLSLTNTATMTNKTLTSPKVGTALEMIEDAVIVFEGATDSANETTLTVVDPTGDNIVSLPDATDTLVGKATTDTLTNKTFDLGGTGNSLTGSLAEFNTALQGDSFVSLTGSETLTNKVLTAPTINAATLSGALAGNFTLVFEGATADDFETTVTVVDPTADRTITLPNITGTVVTTGDTNTVSNAMITNSTHTLQADTNSSTLNLGDTHKIATGDAALSSTVSAVGSTHTTTISTNVDDSSIEIDSSNGLQVKATGITNAMLAGSIAQGKLAGSIPDTKLNQITTAGKVALSALEIDGESAAVTTLVDTDLFIVDDADGAGTGNAKMAASVLKTYLGVGTGNFAIVNLDVDGGTDKAAPVVGDELILADSEASGATVKADVGSILDLISGDVAVDASGVATIQANAVALGTDTTGNYIATLADAGNDFTISNSGAETAAVTIALGNADGDVSVARDLSVTRNLDINGATISLGATTSETTVEDNLTVVGDLTVNGTTTTVNTATLQVTDPLIQLADGNTGGDALDIGFFGEYADSGNQRHAGFVRDASLTALNGATHKGSYVLFANGTAAPTTTFDASGTYDYGALVLQHLAFGTNSSAAVGNATTTPHMLAAGGTTLSHTDGFAAPGQLKRFTLDNCIIDCGTFNGS